MPVANGSSGNNDFPVLRACALIVFNAEQKEPVPQEKEQRPHQRG